MANLCHFVKQTGYSYLEWTSLKLAFEVRKRYIYTDKDDATQWKLTSK
ncbi:hypothetical protein BGX14_1163 [Fibrobacter sp. UWS1]|nr:hypothetical protein BGX14_1163 [Fibrobacter sp. UWS1]